MSSCAVILLYCIVLRPISNKRFKTFDFVLNGCFIKIFCSRSAEVEQNGMLVFNRTSMLLLQNENVNFLPKIHYLACICEAPCTSESCL